MDFSTRLRGINPTNTVFYSPQPRAEVYCLLMNFKISKLAYCMVHVGPPLPKTNRWVTGIQMYKESGWMGKREEKGENKWHLGQQ